jgi:nucleoside-diphosphate-sugar epimerase
MILNVSSQSVYGRRAEPPWGETTIPQPDSLYGQLKLASELLLETACRPHPHIGFSSIRLGTVTGGADGMRGIDVIAKMVRQAMADQDLQVFNADQQLQRIDISDVLDALTVLLERPPQDLRPVYNVGCEAIIRLVDVAGLVADLVAKEVGRPAVSVRVTGSSPDVVPVGLDSTLMFRDTGWKASRSIDESIRSLIWHYCESGPSPDSNGH